MRYLVVLRGLSASGKSTYIKENGFESYTLSSDKYRLMLSSTMPRLDSQFNCINQEYDSHVWKRLYSDLEFRMSHGDFTIIDATHLTRKSIQKYRELCKKYFYRLIVVNFDTDKEICLLRDSTRGIYSVGSDVIQRQLEKIEPLPNSINQISPSFLRQFLDMKYRQLNFDVYNKIHVIGDVHGCYTALTETLKETDEENDAFIFVGDYFDRGIENYEVFKYIYDRLDKDNFFFLRGNHELNIERYLRNENVSSTTFYRNTLQQFKDNSITDKMLKHFCSSLIPCASFWFNKKSYIVSHAGITKSSLVSVFTSDNVFVKGVGSYEDMEKVCEYFASYSDCIQIFGHRNNNDVPIKINSKCYNICGFPEYGGDLKSVTIDKNGICERYFKNNVFSKKGYYIAISKYPNRFFINDVETLVGAFRHNKYVNETKFNNISSFQFSKDAFYKEHWGGIVNKARGIFINTNTNKIVARSYDKFFLLGQYDYCTLDKFTPPFTVYKKYDGFLGIVGYDEESDSILYCSKSILAPFGEYANLFKSKIEPFIVNKEALKKFLKDNNCSIVFECIAPKEDEHIIKYNQDKIILLDIVSNTINYNKPFSYEEYFSIATMYFNQVQPKEFVEKYQIIFDMIDYLKSAKDIEGYVIEDVHGKMFKLKTYQYEADKILRNIKDTYMKIREITNGHDVACPSKEKIIARYCQYYSKNVIDSVVSRVSNVIDEVNGRK